MFVIHSFVPSRAAILSSSSMGSGKKYQQQDYQTPDAGSSSSSHKTPLNSNKKNQKQQQRDEFDTEDGFVGFALALHNLLIVSVSSVYAVCAVALSTELRRT